MYRYTRATIEQQCVVLQSVIRNLENLTLLQTNDEIKETLRKHVFTTKGLQQELQKMLH